MLFSIAVAFGIYKSLQISNQKA
ncbi:hypothetical protein [Winogradskyella poriferorum]